MTNEGSRLRWQAALCAAVALGTAAVSAVGVLGRGDGTTLGVTTPRGEEVRLVVTGVYAWNAERVVAEGIGWDLFDLAVAVPALLAAAAGVARGSLRARLLAVGLLAYLFYQYLMYAVTWAFGPLFLPWVLLYAAGLWGGIGLAAGLPYAELARPPPRFPRRTLAVLAAFMSLAVTAMWLARISAAHRGDLAAASLAGMGTLVVQALDLGLVVPLGLVTAALVWRRHAAGPVLASVFVVKAVAMCGAITAMLLSAWWVEGRLEIAPFALFAGATAGFAVLAVRTYAGVGAPAAQEPRTGRPRTQ